MECGFDWHGASASLLVDFGAAATIRLPDDDALARRRPEPAVWSALEYTAHLRDALWFYDDRIRRTLVEDRPRLDAFGFADACEPLGYNGEVPAQTVEQLTEQANTLVDRFAALDVAQWARVAIGSDGDERTVLVLARRGAHEVRHHALDIRRVLGDTDAPGIA